MAKGKSAEELKRIGAKTRFKKGTEQPRKAAELSADSRNEEKNFLKAIQEWVKNGRLLREVEQSMSDPNERRVIMPIIVKKVLPDNINVNATGDIKRDINIVLRRATPEDAK